MDRRTLRLNLDRKGQESQDLDLARGGDREAYGRLVKAQFGGLYGLLFKLVGSPEDAEDLCQEAFVRAWGALDSLKPGAAFRPWLTRIGVHLFYDYLRKRGRGAAVVALDPIAMQIEGGELTPLENLAGREAQSLLAEAISRLPERLQAAVVMRVVEGREYEEVASAVGLKPATVRTQVSQGRRLLMRLLGPWLRDTGDAS